MYGLLVVVNPQHWTSYLGQTPHQTSILQKSQMLLTAVLLLPEIAKLQQQARDKQTNTSQDEPLGNLAFESAGAMGRWPGLPIMYSWPVPPSAGLHTYGQVPWLLPRYSCFYLYLFTLT